MASSSVQPRSLRPRRCWGLCVLAVASVVLLTPSSAFLPAAGARGAVSNRPTAALTATTLAMASALPAQAADATAKASADSSPLVTVGAVLGLIAVGILVLTRDVPSEKVNDAEVVEKYFNGEGFERWNKIYGEEDDVNAVQKDIRVGHAETVDTIISWIGEKVDGKTVCDAGCGTGNLSIPLASRGAVVTGSDISQAMATESARRAEIALKDAPKVKKMPEFFTSDLQKLDGEYDTVCCVDVLIHYPPEKMEGMVGHLAGMSKESLVMSFAPKTWYYTLLKRFGELFPGKSKATRAYLHSEETVEAAINKAGFEVVRKTLTAKSFYFSQIFEAKPKAKA